MLSKVAVLTLATLGAAAPAVEESSQVKVPIASRRSLTQENGEVDMVALLQSVNNTLTKYHSATVLPSLDTLLSGIGGLGKRSNVKLNDQVAGGNDELYYGPTIVGGKKGKPQTFTIDFDTGSADFFVPGPKCGSTQGCSGNTKYDQGGKDEHNTTTITYGSGMVTGENYFDVVTVGGLKAKHTNVISLTTAQGFANSASEGLMGMGFSSIAESKQPTFFERLIALKKVKVPEFSFYLGRAKSNTASKSELTLGGRDASRYTGGFTKVPVTTKGYWQVKLDSVDVAGKSAGAGTAGQAAIDTGTTIILAPTAAAQEIFNQFPGAQVDTLDSSGGITFYSYPCNSKTPVQIVFAGKKFVINPLDFSLGKASGLFSQLTSSTPPSKRQLGGDRCVAAIGGADIKPAENLYVVGDSFLKNWYATFSYAGGASVNFAKSK